MGEPKKPLPVNLICAVTYSEGFNVDEALFALQELFGPFDLESERYDFSSYTDYYEPEMGRGLEKFFLSFERLIDPESIAEIKLETNSLEEEFALGGRRRVNLDPGYVGSAQLVLATTKGYAHRIYLKKGIYAEVTLIYRGGGFRPLEWTYPDYRSDLALRFFGRVRNLYLSKLKGTKDAHKDL